MIVFASGWVLRPLRWRPPQQQLALGSSSSSSSSSSGSGVRAIGTFKVVGETDEGTSLAETEEQLMMQRQQQESLADRVATELLPPILLKVNILGFRV